MHMPRCSAVLHWQLFCTAAELCAALGMFCGNHALLWHPKNPKNSMTLWDTWLFAQPGQDAVRKFYMNYLSTACSSWSFYKSSMAFQHLPVTCNLSKHLPVTCDYWLTDLMMRCKYFISNQEGCIEVVRLQY